MREQIAFNYMIKDMPLSERPQERLIKYGPEMLNNAELLALIIRTGSREESALRLSERILYSLRKEGEEDGLKALRNVSLDTLMKIKGVGEAKASMILAAVTLAKRLSVNCIHEKVKISTPEDAVNYVMNDMKSLPTEHFRILSLNTKKEIMYIREISHGTVNMTVVHPREVFRKAIEDGAHSIILLHNHPSGDPNPSQEDLHLTKRLKDCAEIVGISIVDHIIIGEDGYYSFLKEGILN